MEYEILKIKIIEYECFRGQNKLKKKIIIYINI